MTKTRFSLKWTAIFSIMLAFTAFALSSKFIKPNTAKAYATKLAADSSVDTSKYWVVLGEKALSKKADHPNRQFWLNLKRAAGNERICAMNESQFQTLSDQYGAEKHDVLINNANLKIVTVPYSQQNKKDIRTDLRLNDNDIENNCRIIEQNFLFYLIFDNQIS